MRSSDANALGILLGAGIAVLLIVSLVFVAMYVLHCIGIRKALKKMEYDNLWLAWIPFGQWYALADALDEDPVALVAGVEVPLSLFKFWWVLTFILPVVPVIGSICLIVLNFLCAGWTYGAVYAECDGKERSDTAVLGYLSVLLYIIPFIKFLCIKNED